MKFIIDAQLPPSLKYLFRDKGFECIHSLDLEDKNFTTDRYNEYVIYRKVDCCIKRQGFF